MAINENHDDTLLAPLNENEKPLFNSWLSSSIAPTTTVSTSTLAPENPSGLVWLNSASHWAETASPNERAAGVAALLAMITTTTTSNSGSMNASILTQVQEDSAVSQDTSTAASEEDDSTKSPLAAKVSQMKSTDFTHLFARLGILSSSDTPSLVVAPPQQQQQLLPIRQISTVMPPTIRGTSNWPAPLPLPPPGEEANASRLAVLLRGGAPPPPLPLHNSILPNTEGRPRPLFTHTMHSA